MDFSYWYKFDKTKTDPNWFLGLKRLTSIEARRPTSARLLKNATMANCENVKLQLTYKSKT